MTPANERPAVRTYIHGPGRYAVCPFCGHDCEVRNAIRGCAGCGAAYREAGGRWLFKKGRKT
jgi:hypothetical protein